MDEIWGGAAMDTSGPHVGISLLKQAPLVRIPTILPRRARSLLVSHSARTPNYSPPQLLCLPTRVDVTVCVYDREWGTIRNRGPVTGKEQVFEIVGNVVCVKAFPTLVRLFYRGRGGKMKEGRQGEGKGRVGYSRGTMAAIH